MNENYTRSKIYSLPNLVRPPYPLSVGTVFASKSIKVNILDKEGYAPINLARTSFTSKDKNIDESLQRLSFEERCAKLNETSNGILKAEKSSTLYTQSKDSYVYINNAICPIDVDLLNRAGIRTILHIANEPSECRVLAKIYRDIGFLSGLTSQKTMAKTSFVSRLRDINYGRRSIHGAIMVCPQSFLNDVRKLANISNWMSEILKSASLFESSGSQFSLISLGLITSATEAYVKEVHNRHALSFLELFEADRWSADPPWRSKFSGEETAFARLWTDKFQDAGGVFEAIAASLGSGSD